MKWDEAFDGLGRGRYLDHVHTDVFSKVCLFIVRLSPALISAIVDGLGLA